MVVMRNVFSGVLKIHKKYDLKGKPLKILIQISSDDIMKVLSKRNKGTITDPRQTNTRHDKPYLEKIFYPPRD